jgi:hypothetical protein
MRVGRAADQYSTNIGITEHCAVIGHCLWNTKIVCAALGSRLGYVGHYQHTRSRNAGGEIRSMHAADPARANHGDIQDLCRHTYSMFALKISDIWKLRLHFGDAVFAFGRAVLHFNSFRFCALRAQKRKGNNRKYHAAAG